MATKPSGPSESRTHLQQPRQLDLEPCAVGDRGIERPEKCVPLGVQRSLGDLPGLKQRSVLLKLPRSCVQLGQLLCLLLLGLRQVFRRLLDRLGRRVQLALRQRGPIFKRLQLPMLLGQRGLRTNPSGSALLRLNEEGVPPKVVLTHLGFLHL